MLFVAVTITLSLLAIGYLVQNAVQRHFAEQDAEELGVVTGAVEEALRKVGEKGLEFREVLAQAVSGHHGVFFQVWDENNNLLYGPAELWPDQQISIDTPINSIKAESLKSWVTKGKTFRGTATYVRIDGLPYRIVAAIDMSFHLQFLSRFSKALWLIMILTGIVTILAAWFGVHKGHEPLRVLDEAMRGIKADRMDMRLDVNTVPSELISLVESFNRMISRLEESFVRLSHFSADIAHELRTPLTNLITQTQVGLGKSRSHQEYRELLYSNLEEQERLAKMVNDMLWLAQSENGLLKLDWEILDLVQEVHAIFEFFEALAEEKGISLQVVGKSAEITGDRVMLRRVLSNLLSNALRYTHEGEKVQVRIWAADSSVNLSVENKGPNIAAKHLPRLFDRFYRIDPSRQRHTEGAGLGLAIVKSIVEAHEGSVSVSSELGKTVFTIKFPRVD